MAKIRAKTILILTAVFLILITVGFLSAMIDRAVTTGADVTSIADEINANVPVGQLYLEAQGVSQSQPAKILLNGYYAADLNSAQKTVDVPDGCVVEINARGLRTPITVRIVGKSAGVISDCEGRSVTAAGNIANLGMFLVRSAN